MKIAAQALQIFVQRILFSAGFPTPKADLVADALIAANLRGVDTHGVHLLPYYIEQLRVGNIDPETDGRVLSESGACLLYDGEHGVGHYISDICCRHAVRLATQHGIGIAIALRSTHFGAAAYWARRISAAGMIGIVMCNASPSVPPWQGRSGRIGTNPICVSVPSSGSGGWLLDMATTTVALNAVKKAALAGEPSLPVGWAMDSDGIPTTDTQKALNGLLMPLGGYKGSGLGMMVEILCAVLSGGAMSTEVGGIHIKDRPINTSQTFLSIDVTRFLTLEEFQSRMEALIQFVKSAPPASGYSEILVAGDPEMRAENDRVRNGIPVDESLWKRLTALAEELGVPFDRQSHLS
jgi:LDH2 family malate/lactate/ureidoglycolate dehydrogenase